MNIRRTAATTCLTLCGLVPAVNAEAAAPTRTLATNPVLKEREETPAQHDARMAWWREAKFGMFVHWGLYAQAGGEWQGKPVPGGYAEWIMFNGKIPIAEYARLAKDFNPVKYNAEKWVLAAKNAGMKYIVITAKHHDGFAMFKSAASPFNIVDATPFGRDPLKELAAACRKHGMKLGFYYSHNYDWHHPGGGMGDWDPTHKGDPDKYIDGVVIPQLREILKNYGEIAVLWFDMGAGNFNRAAMDRIHQAVLECNPQIIMNNRLGSGYAGDTETPEQSIPPNGFPGKDWETCMTVNGTWGYSKRDNGWKSAADMLRNLCKIASKGGNYLLNVGPNELGEIPEPCLERFEQVGEWMKTNGAAIYGSSASPFPHALPWGGVTCKDNSLYLCVNQLPADRKLTLPELTTRIGQAYFLADPKKQALTITRLDNQIQTIEVPAKPPVSCGEAPVVIVAELQGGPVATLLDFQFPGMPEATLSGTNIHVRVPLATDLTKLAPIYHTGSPRVTGKPASGSVNDFTKPLSYTITGADGSTKSYVVTVTPAEGAVGVPNPSFEKFNFLDEYDEVLEKGSPITTWVFRKVTGNGELGIRDLVESPGAPPPPDGTRHCVYMRGAGNGVAQAITFDKGTYTVSLDVVKRNGYEKTAAPLLVTLDGATVWRLDPTQIAETWANHVSPDFPVTAGIHTLGIAPGEGEGMDMIDNVRLHYGK